MIAGGRAVTAGYRIRRFFGPIRTFGKYQEQRKAMKMATSKKQVAVRNQVSAPTANFISRHGGRRMGAGRKPGSRNKPSFDLDPCVAALAKALDDKPAFLFIMAMKALDAPLDDVREALGLTRDQFMREYGVFLTETAKLAEQGSLAYFAGKKARPSRALVA